MTKDVTEFEPTWAGAGGAIVSTPADLNRFWPAVNRLLPRWALAEMRTTKPATDLGDGIEYGLGIANISGRDDSGRTATVYITAQTSERLLHAFDAAFCA